MTQVSMFKMLFMYPLYGLTSWYCQARNMQSCLEWKYLFILPFCLTASSLFYRALLLVKKTTSLDDLVQERQLLLAYNSFHYQSSSLELFKVYR